MISPPAIDEGFVPSQVRTRSIAIGPDGQFMYVTLDGDDALLLFTRDAATGSRSLTTTLTNATAGFEGMPKAPDVISMSPSGEHLFLTDIFGTGIAVFKRDATTGALTFVQRSSTDTEGLHGIVATAPSPDNRHLYAVALFDNALATFAITD